MNADRIFWRVGGEEIAAENVFFNVSSPDGGGGGDTSTLSLRPSANHTVHTGAYECVAVRGAATFSTNFTITVQCKPFL